MNIARVLAFSMATLAALGIAAGQDLTPAQKMRYFGRANALNRSADQTERTMTQRRRDQRGTTPSQRPDTVRAEPQTAAIPDLIDDEMVAALVEEAMAEFRATQASRPITPAAAPTKPVPPEPPKSAIHATQTAAAPGAKASYKANLMQHSAIHRVAAMNTTPPPG